MDEIIGTSNRILDIDLSEKKWKVFTVSEIDRKHYIGGKGLGLKLVYDRMPPGIEPLGKMNIIAVMTGVLTGTGAPCSGRFEAVTKSPLTGIMTSSSCGGPFGMQLKKAGYDGLLIRGRAESLCSVYFDHETVEFRDASHLSGLDTAAVQEALLNKKQAALVIGPAGENLVRFANVASGHRFLGRGGLGAVMGSKNLKAVVADGRHYTIVPKDPEGLKTLKKKAQVYINRNGITLKMRKYGTAANVVPVNKANMLPVKNFSSGSHDQAFRVSGEMIYAKNATTIQTCKPCSILCGHEGQFNGHRTAVPEYETLTILGTNLGIFDRDLISGFNDVCNRLGLDTISAGGTLAWVMEAAEKGYVKSELRFGYPEGITEALEDIALGQGFGSEMGLGSRALAARYGGREFAINVKGLELPGYDPRGAFGQGLAYAVANRGGCHLSASIFAIEIIYDYLKPDKTAAKPEFVKFFEDLTCSVNSLQACHFTQYSYTLEPWLTRYTPDSILRFLMNNLPDIAIKLMDISLYPMMFTAVTGIPMSSREFLRIGERIHVLERLMNTREGITRADDTLPDRLVFEPRPGDDAKRMVPVDELVSAYYRKRGYDSDGTPKPSLLARLRIPSEQAVSRE